MIFEPNNFYHIYNRGINRQTIFPLEENYLFFISKIEKLISPNCSIVAYCLMPNHYHLLIWVDDGHIAVNKSGQMQNLKRKFGTLQSSYTRAINNQHKRTGSLFQAKFKAIELSGEHALTCFHYIHQNPVKADLANHFEDWPYCSYSEYARTSAFQLCDKSKAFEFLNIPEDLILFKRLSSEVIINEKTLANLEPQLVVRP